MQDECTCGACAVCDPAPEILPDAGPTVEELFLASLPTPRAYLDSDDFYTNLPDEEFDWGGDFVPGGENSGKTLTFRARVPGGWLYRCGKAMVFVPLPSLGSW